MSQIDVAPTLLGMFNFDYQSQFFGRDVFNELGKSDFALISNYQYLGKYNQEGLTYLKPKKEVIFDPDPFSKETSSERLFELENAEVIVPEFIQDVVSYYQAANRVVEGELNKHTPPVSVKKRR